MFKTNKALTVAVNAQAGMWLTWLSRRFQKKISVLTLVSLFTQSIHDVLYSVRTEKRSEGGGGVKGSC